MIRSYFALLVRRYTTKSHPRLNTGWEYGITEQFATTDDLFTYKSGVLEVLAGTVSDDGNIQDKKGVFSAKYS